MSTPRRRRGECPIPVRTRSRREHHGTVTSPVVRPQGVNRAITLRGAELTEAIVRGFKDIENRKCRLPVGWVALHTGQGSIEPVERAKIEALCPGLPAAASCPRGAVVGVCFVQRCVPFEALRREQGCGGDCDLAASHHSPSCRLNPFATGVMCNIISMAVRLPKPVPCKGQLGCWGLPLGVREEVEAQLAGMSRQQLHINSSTHPRSPSNHIG